MKVPMFFLKSKFANLVALSFFLFASLMADITVASGMKCGALFMNIQVGELTPLKNQSYTLAKAGLKYVAIDNKTGKTRHEIQIIHIFDSFREGKKTYVRENSKGEPQYLTSNGNVFLVIDRQNGINAFDSNGLSLGLPKEVQFLSNRDITNAIQLRDRDEIDNIPHTLMIELKNGTVYQLGMRSFYEYEKLGVAFWAKKMVKVRTAKGEEIFLSANQYAINTEALKQTPGQLSSLQKVSEYGVDYAYVQNAGQTLDGGGNVIAVNYRGGIRTLFTSKLGLFSYDPIANVGNPKYLSIDPATKINLSITDMVQVGNHLIAITDNSFLRSFRLSDVFSDSQMISFEKSYSGLPDSKGPVASGITTRLEATSNNRFRIINYDQQNKKWSVQIFEILENSEIVLVP